MDRHSLLANPGLTSDESQMGDVESIGRSIDPVHDKKNNVLQKEEDFKSGESQIVDSASVSPSEVVSEDNAASSTIQPVSSKSSFNLGEAKSSPTTTTKPVKPLNPLVRQAFSTGLRFWTVWRVLGLMFSSILGGILLGILSLVSVIDGSWQLDAIGRMNLGLMTVSSLFLTGSIIFVIIKVILTRGEKRTNEQIWVLSLVLVCWFQPYLNPIALGLRWNSISSATTPEEGELQHNSEGGYTINEARISGCCSTVLLTGLYIFCFYEMQRFRAERIRFWRFILFAYFIIRLCFTLVVDMDMGSVPIAPLCTIIRFQITEGEKLPITRICGIVIISLLDMVVWTTNFVFHRNTRPLLMRRIYDEDGKARAVQYGLSVVTVVIWTTQIFIACIVILCTPSSRLLSRNLAFSGTSVNTIGCCCAFMLVCWVLALAFANFPLASQVSGESSSKKASSNGAKLDVGERVRVRYYNLEHEVPSWAVLIVNGRRHFSNRPPSHRTRSSGERQSSMNSQDAVIEEEGTTFATKAKHMLTNSINAFGEALSSDWSMPVLDSNQNGGTVVNFVFEHACLCLNFSFIVYNTGNFAKPQTNAQVQLLVEDPSYKVHRQISSPQLDVHAIVFVSKEAVIVSFRGTHSSQNIRTDATFNWKNHHPSLDWEYDSSSYWARRYTPKIHAGFRKAYAAIRSSLLICVEELLDEEPMRPIRLCGHSMGGSLACLFAFDVRKKLAVDPAQISVYTFGSSRLGNESFRVRYNDAVPQSFSFFCARDPVTKLPPRFPFGIPLGYKHHGIPIMLLPNGSLVIKPSRAEVAVLHTYAPTDLNVHRIRAYAQSLINWTVLQGLEQTFRPFWNSVVGQVHRLPFDELRNPHLLRYLLLDDVGLLSITNTPWTSGPAPSQSAKDALLAQLSKALSERPFQKKHEEQQHQQQNKDEDLALLVSVNAVRLPSLTQPRPPHHNFPGGFSAMSQMGMITPRQIISDIMGMVKRDQTSTMSSSSIDADLTMSTMTTMTTTTRVGEGTQRPEGTPPSLTDSNVEENSNSNKLDDQMVENKTSSTKLLHSDVIYVSVTCGSVEATGPASSGEENDAVDEPEQVSNEAKRAMGTWVKGLDKPLAFGGAAQKLRPDVDRLTFRVFRRATECTCEGRLASLIRSIPNTASHAISNAMMVSSSSSGLPTLDHRHMHEVVDTKQPSPLSPTSTTLRSESSMDGTSDSSMPVVNELNSSELGHLCESCARPVCLARGDLAVSSVFDDLDPHEAKDVIVSASPLHDTGLRENLILKVKLWSPSQRTNTPLVTARRASSRRQSSEPVSIQVPLKPENVELRTAGPMPLYDTVGLKTIAAGELFPDGFILRIRPIKAMGAPYNVVKSPWYRIRQTFGGGGGSMYCKISIPGIAEKGLTASRKWTRVPFASPSSEELFHSSSSIPLVGSLLPRYISTPDVIRENVVLMTEKIKAQKVLQVEFGSDSLVFGSKLLLTGFEEVVVRVRPPKRWFRLNLGRGEIEGYVVVELHKIIRHIASAQMSAIENGEGLTYNKSFARWFPLRGPNACGKVLLAMELLPVAPALNHGKSEVAVDTSSSPSLLMDNSSSSTSDFSQLVEEDIPEIGTSPPLRSVRFESPPHHRRQLSVTAPHYCLELVLYGLRFLPSEYERVSFHIQVRDEYNPRQRISVRMSQIEHMGVVAGWSFAPQRVALGFSDPSSSLEGSEQISLRILDRREDTIAKRDFRLRDILADFAEGQSSSENLVSLLAWLVLPYKSSLLANKRNPEVKVFIRIVQAEHALSLERSLNLV